MRDGAPLRCAGGIGVAFRSDDSVTNKYCELWNWSSKFRVFHQSFIIHQKYPQSAFKIEAVIVNRPGLEDSQDLKGKIFSFVFGQKIKLKKGFTSW